jgi:hypothetical protein
MAKMRSGSRDAVWKSSLPSQGYLTKSADAGQQR